MIITEPATAIQEAEAFPLAEAVYCLDCDSVSRRTPSMACVVCESGSTLNLARVLNRQSEVGSGQLAVVNQERRKAVPCPG